MDNIALSKLIQYPLFYTAANGELLSLADSDVQMRTDFKITYLLLTLE